CDQCLDVLDVGLKGSGFDCFGDCAHAEAKGGEADDEQRDLPQAPTGDWLLFADQTCAGVDWRRRGGGDRLGRPCGWWWGSWNRLGHFQRAPPLAIGGIGRHPCLQTKLSIPRRQRKIRYCKFLSAERSRTLQKLRGGSNSAF